MKDIRNDCGIDYTGSGEYLEIDRPRRLVFTFAMLQFSPNSDRITVEIAPSGSGCILTLTQAGIDIADELRQLPLGVEGGTEQGWNDMFDALAAALGSVAHAAAGHDRFSGESVNVYDFGLTQTTDLLPFVGLFRPAGRKRPTKEGTYHAAAG